MSDRTHSWTRVIVGLALVAFGVLVTLDNLDIADTEDFLAWWPLIVIGFGVAHLAERRQSPFGSFVIIGIGSWLLLENLGVIEYSFWDLWPLLLVLLGIRLVIRSSTPAPPASSSDGDTPATADTTISPAAFLGAVACTNVSKNFYGGKATAMMGGTEIDLRQAKIGPDGATIDVFAMWGGIDIRVPPDWSIDNRATAILGAVEDHTSSTGDSKQRLVLTGFVVMGGVEIKN